MEELLQVDISHPMCLRLRCTVDTTRNRSRSPEFRFQGGRFKLSYEKWYPYQSWIFLRLPDTHYFGLYLHKCSGVPHRRPFRVTVTAETCSEESGGQGVETVLPQWTPVEGAYEVEHEIWCKREEEILRAVSEFQESRVLTLIVLLESVAEIERIGESRPIALSSIQLRNTPCQESLLQDFSRMLDQDSFADVEFQCVGESTRAHGVVVSARSKVIAAMLSSDMIEGRTRVVKIPNMEPEVFRHFLRYLYTGTLPPELTVELALNLCEAGDQYAVLGLVNVCSEYLRENLTVQNAYEVLVIADSHHNAELKEAVIDFMVVKRVPRTSDRWKDFCKAHPMLAIEVYDRFCPK